MQTQALLKGTPIRGRYRVESRIGQGGMGSVYRATDLLTGEPVALKHVRYDRFQRRQSVERFRREGETLARLDHPNIVRVVELLFDGDSDLIVMEFVPGGSLADLLEATAVPLALERVLEIALDICDAITRCHRLGVIHRDLKPSNILIAEDGSPKLSDFGVAHVQGKKRLTDVPMLIGTTEYLSPEALCGDEADARADVWSFGVLLFELLTSQNPFAGRTVADVLRAITFSEPPELTTLRPECPRKLAELVHGMLAKDRNQRIPSLRQVSAALDDVSRGRAAEAQHPGGRSAARDGLSRALSHSARRAPPEPRTTARVLANGGCEAER